MNITSPKISANNKHKQFVRKEIKFNNQQQLRAYLVDAVSKNKKKSFNMKIIIN